MTVESQKPTSGQRSFTVFLLLVPLLIWTIIVGIAIGFFRWSVMASLVYSAYLILLPLPVVFYFKWLRGRKNRGELLLDCGPHFQKNLMKFGTAASLFTVILMVINYLVAEKFHDSQHTSMICMFAVGMSFFANSGAGFGHLSFHKNGLWTYAKLVPWVNVKRYEWRKSGFWGYSRLRLSSSSDSWNNFTDRFLMISDDQKDAVQELLQKYTDANEVVAEEL